MYEALSDVLSDERDRCEACGETKDLVRCGECQLLFCTAHVEDLCTRYHDLWLCAECDGKLTEKDKEN